MKSSKSVLRYLVGYYYTMGERDQNIALTLKSILKKMVITVKGVLLISTFNEIYK